MTSELAVRSRTNTLEARAIIGNVRANPRNHLNDKTDSLPWYRVSTMASSKSLIRMVAERHSCHDPGHDPGHQPAFIIDGVGTTAVHDLEHGHDGHGGAEDASQYAFRAIARVIHPFVFIFAVYGILPVRLGPIRISTNPFRSSLLYVLVPVLVMQVLMVMSSYFVYTSFRQDAISSARASAVDSVDHRIGDITSLLPALSHVIRILTTFEMYRLKKCVENMRYFLRNYASFLGVVKLRLVTRAMPWFSALICLVFSPLVTAFYYMYSNAKNAQLVYIPSSYVQFIFSINSLSIFAAACMVVRDLAANLSDKLSREKAHHDPMTAARLEEYRMAWLSLRTVTKDLGSMPITGLSLMTYLTIAITLCAYQFVVSFNKETIGWVANLLAFLFFESTVLIICDSAHRLADEMTFTFLELLLAPSWRKLPQDLLAEHQQFLHTITSNPPEVTFAGMVSIKRSTYLSMRAAITTYLIVLFQFRESDDEGLPVYSPRNSSIPSSALI